MKQFNPMAAAATISQTSSIQNWLKSTNVGISDAVLVKFHSTV